METAETNRSPSLSLARSTLADAANANAATPLSTLLERKKTPDIWRDRETVGAKPALAVS